MFIFIVALFTRAWIEILNSLSPVVIFITSPSSRGRGLKFLRTVIKLVALQSPSSRGRGLKYLFGIYLSAKSCRPLHEGVD